MGGDASSPNKAWSWTKDGRMWGKHTLLSDVAENVVPYSSGESRIGRNGIELFSSVVYSSSGDILRGWRFGVVAKFTGVIVSTVLALSVSGDSFGTSNWFILFYSWTTERLSTPESRSWWYICFSCDLGLGMPFKVVGDTRAFSQLSEIDVLRFAMREFFYVPRGQEFGSSQHS